LVKSHAEIKEIQKLIRESDIEQQENREERKKDDKLASNLADRNDPAEESAVDDLIAWDE
jgi:hypothetical protein